jgi:hypothetical protein
MTENPPPLETANLPTGPPQPPLLPPQSPQQPPTPSDDGGILGKVTPIALVLSGALYASGYTVILTASQRLGIVDPGNGVFKGKYLQAGAYCVAFILLVGAICFVASARIAKAQYKEQYFNDELPLSRLLSPLLLLIALLFQSFLIWPNRASWALLGGMISYFTFALAAALLGWFDIKKPRTSKLAAWVLTAFTLLIISSCVAIRFFYPLKRYMLIRFLIKKPGPMCQEGLAIAVLILLCLFLGRLFYVLAHAYLHTSGEKRWFWCVLTMPLLLFGAYDAVIGFAVIIYPYIPFEKGGGDYQSVSTVCFYDSSDKPLSRPTGKLVILLETDEYYFVAQDDPRNRRYWGKLGQSPLKRIYQISRQEVSRAEYEPDWSLTKSRSTQPSIPDPD